jgi:hypothetical protein
MSCLSFPLAATQGGIRFHFRVFTNGDLFTSGLFHGSDGRFLQQFFKSSVSQVQKVLFIGIGGEAYFQRAGAGKKNRRKIFCDDPSILTKFEEKVK